MVTDLVSTVLESKRLEIEYRCHQLELWFCGLRLKMMRKRRFYNTRDLKDLLRLEKDELYNINITKRKKIRLGLDRGVRTSVSVTEGKGVGLYYIGLLFTRKWVSRCTSHGILFDLEFHDSTEEAPLITDNRVTPNEEFHPPYSRNRTTHLTL